MAQRMQIWMRAHGGMALLAGGMGIYVVLLVLDLSVGWRLAYPYSLAWVVVVALPAAGIALMYLETCEDGESARPDEGEIR